MAVNPALATPMSVDSKDMDGKLAEKGVLSDVPPLQNAAPPPSDEDGGLQAWCTLIGGVLTLAATMGYTSSFGVYQDHYTRIGGISASNASWIGSTQQFLLVFLGLPAGKLVDSGYFRLTLFLGSIIYIGSLLAVSYTDPHEYYQLFLAQGLGMGVGNGILYVPALAVQTRHWKRRRPMAVGIVMLGVALGGVIFPIVLNRVLVSESFPRAVRATMFIIIGFLGAANLLMTCPPLAHKPETPPISAIVRDGAYWFLTFGALLTLTGLFFPYFYLQFYSILHGISPNLAFYSLVVMNAASIPGRFIPNLFVPRIGVFNLLIPFTALCGVLVFALFGVSSAGGMFGFAVVYGICSGAWLTLITTTFASTARNLSEVGVRMGFGYSIASLGILFGNPIDGALLGARHHWVRPIVFASMILLGGAIMLLVARGLVGKRKGTGWV